MKLLRRIAPLILTMLLSGCSVLEGTPKAPPPLTTPPQEIQRNQTLGLQRTGTVSAMIYGSPMDVEAAIKAKAAAAKADYYVIVMIDDTVFPGQWYSQAILYRK
ncbi:biofilm peroxide resistance protein BsmA [Superficieibacter electus]|uniref:Biofilm peroxide resistance protein BsmA n=1 Tax=Superficieibacter electus TaxID=2022662 RepID=A0A2P5GIG4_9ENTR|nr:biofilm peroxide resistance protein BsmA [Superficieibacter electus]POP41038.1 biofilm peroxide resistance protein BsmA [Superficieibacter electus]POP42932.1 biofilm peroxide resistance protein BsmA [Superficieibacter electus]